MQPELRKRIAYYLYYTGLVLLVASLPLSKFAMSISQFLLAAGWLLDGGTGNKFRKFFGTGMALLLASVYVLHLIGLIHTVDFDYAFKDLRIKLPLLILPLLLATGPKISKARFEGILLALIAGVTVSSLISLSIYLGIMERPVNDIRDISIFISHIRLALLCCLAVFSVIWLIWQHRHQADVKYYYLMIPVVVWLVYFMILLESLTGLSILIITLIIITNGFVYKRSGTPVKLLVLAVSIIVPVSVYYYVKSVNQTFQSHELIDISKLEKSTPSGNEYHHFPDRVEYENGNHLWLYLCESELEKEWNIRSKYVYNGMDRRNQEIRFTLMRFLTSKGLRKDSTGVWSLSPAEIASIENGIANVNYQGQGHIGTRIHQVLWELNNYRKTGNPSGHSVAQRLEFWKASMGIISKNALTGVGTGDLPQAFKERYETMKTLLSPEWQLRSHNQYLSIAIAFGLPGLAWFLVTLIYPLLRQIRKRDLLYISFSIISILSMVTEDTLETQAGVTFFALFTSLFLFVNPNNDTTGGK